MPKVKWRSVSLPAEMIKLIEEYIEDNPREGFTSVATFITTVIREHPLYKQILEKSKHN